jgi:ATP-dependent Clp protease ATP-binding subunit ClpC
MLCVRCNKRPAVIFLQRIENGQTKQEGYCLHCAREMHIKPVDDLMKQFGMSDQDLDTMEEKMDSMMEEMGDAGTNPFSMMMGMNNADADDPDAPEGSGEDGFTPGGNATFPFGIGAKREKKDGEDDAKGGKKPPKRKYLDTYCDNLTEKARTGKLDAIIGRDREIYRTVQILSRRQKNNPCLIGEAGVGKTAIAEGIAERIAAGQVPACLRHKEIYLLDLTALVAGTQFRGQFEQRVKGLISEVKAAGNVILFIDEIHTITAAGESEGAMNAGNILKPALSRGEIQVIGATTFSEYRKYIEKDQALERRFQPVRVEEPSISDTIAVMNGIKKYYEAYHHVQVPAEIVTATVTLAERYITDRFLPDKAIDLLDEACACCNLAHPVISEYLEDQAAYDGLKAEEAEMENAPADQPIDYEHAAEIKTRIAKLESELPAKKQAAEGIAVSMDDVAKVIELWTGIPAVKIRESEYSKLLGLEGELKKKIIGQDEAVHLVAQAIKRSRADLSGRRRPASFIFVGPTGVGKTELVKQLAGQLFDGPDPLIRLDMSEYMEKFAVSRMIGSPPGYVGYDEAGQLTEKVRRRPYSVVLFDEIEKAHPDVMNILLQILDEGKINDAQGRTVDFSNTVICMTSNAGSSEQGTGSLGFNKTAAEAGKEKAMKALSDFLRPEFLGRVDEVIAFNPLSHADLEKIAALTLEEYRPGMEAKGIAFFYTPAALTALVDACAGGKYGARDLRRTVRKQVEDPMAERLIGGGVTSGGQLTVDAEDGKIVLR